MDQNGTKLFEVGKSNGLLTTRTRVRQEQTFAVSQTVESGPAECEIHEETLHGLHLRLEHMDYEKIVKRHCRKILRQKRSELVRTNGNT